MSAESSYFRLGVFVIAATALLCAGVIVLGAGELLERKFVVETYMTQSAEGIGAGSAVKYRGVEMGAVTEVSLAARKYDTSMMQQGRMQSPILVELRMVEASTLATNEVEFGAWLEQAVAAGLRARIASSGITGPAFVELVYLDPEKFPAPELRWSPPSLYIPSAPSTTQVLMASIETILEKLRALPLKDVVNDLDTLLVNANGKLDELDVHSISDEAVAFLAEVRKSNDRLQEILNNPNIDPSLADLRAMLQNAKDATGRVNELLQGPRVTEILDNLASASGEMTPALVDVRRAVRRIDRLIAAQQATMASAIEELDRAMTNIRELTEDAKQNPSRILFGDPPPHSKTGDDR